MKQAVLGNKTRNFGPETPVDQQANGPPQPPPGTSAERY